jgi:hypothetical protein
VRAEATAKAEGARGSPIPKNTKETVIRGDQAWESAATPSLPLLAALSADRVRVNGGAALYSFVMATTFIVDPE